jgi:PEP-CTERM motif
MDIFRSNRHLAVFNVPMMVVATSIPVSRSTSTPTLDPITEVWCDDQGCLPGSGYYGNYNRIPVTLGSSLTLVSNSYMTNQSVPFDNVSSGGGNATYYFRFFEADGTTPVGVEMVSDAPEPSTYGLIGLSLAGAALLRRKASSLVG